MNTPGIPPGVGGFLFNGKPIWHPPISASWIVCIILLVIAANAEEISPKVRSILLHPAGFFVFILIGLVLFDLGYAHVSFAGFFLLLMLWSSSKERFINPSGTLDWVTNDKRWFSEVVLKEKPIAIQGKDVATYPVQGS